MSGPACLPVPLGTYLLALTHPVVNLPAHAYHPSFQAALPTDRKWPFTTLGVEEEETAALERRMKLQAGADCGGLRAEQFHGKNNSSLAAYSAPSPDFISASLGAADPLCYNLQNSQNVTFHYNFVN